MPAFVLRGRLWPGVREQALDAARLLRLIEGGFLAVDAEGIRTTPEGRLRLNAVLSALLA